MVLVVPQVMRTTQRAYQAQCASNLKEIYQAILLFTADHRGVLPGPQFQYVTLAKNNLPYFLKEYLGEDYKNRDSGVWRCPANHYVNELNAESRAGNKVERSAYFARNPFFGYNYNDPDKNIAPMTLARISEMKTPEGVAWLLSDIDGWNYGVKDRIGGDGKYPPVHTGKRNYLMWDGSVDFREIKRK